MTKDKAEAVFIGFVGLIHTQRELGLPITDKDIEKLRKKYKISYKEARI